MCLSVLCSSAEFVDALYFCIVEKLSSPKIWAWFWSIKKILKHSLARESGKTSTVKPAKVFYEETVFLFTAHFRKDFF